ncbi:MAG: hypothetical protein AABW79_02505 [Nanoarchaeota archaeon]
MSNLKRGLAPIIIGILIILISIVAITIIWTSIKPTLLSPQNSCLTAELNPEIIIQSACYDQEAQETILVLERKIDSSISEIGIIISNSQENEKFSCSNACGTCTLLSAGERKTYYLANENLDDPKTLTITSNKCKIQSESIKNCNSN